MKKKVLIVEDDASLRKMYAFKLDREGFTAEEAENGLIGLEKTLIFLPDAILLDLRMPVMDGEAMLTKLREKDWGKDIKVIILTNINKREAPMSLSFLSVSRFIVKAHSTPSQVIDILCEVMHIPRHS